MHEVLQVLQRETDETVDKREEIVRLLLDIGKQVQVVGVETHVHINDEKLVEITDEVEQLDQMYISVHVTITSMVSPDETLLKLQDDIEPTE